MALDDPAFAMQAGVYSALTTWPDMIAAFGGAPRVYDTVPVDPAGNVVTGAFPYVVIGDDQLMPGAPGSSTKIREIYVKVEIWSRPKVSDWGEAKTIGGAVIAALDRPIDLVGHGVITHELHEARYIRQPDRLTRQGVITIKYETAPIGLPPNP